MNENPFRLFHTADDDAESLARRLDAATADEGIAYPALCRLVADTDGQACRLRGRLSLDARDRIDSALSRAYGAKSARVADGRGHPGPMVTDTYGGTSSTHRALYATACRNALVLVRAYDTDGSCSLLDQ